MKPEHSQPSPGLIQMIFTFPTTDISIEGGGHFCDATDIIKNATEKLKRLSHNGFQECFQHLYSRWQKCMFAAADYIERNVAEMIVLVCVSQT
jgi:hypothetical protein